MSNSKRIDGYLDSLWMQTACAEPETHPLSESRKCDVAVIGAGFTGLNAALTLASNNTSTCVLDAGPLGIGSSGRSGGQVNLGLNLGPMALKNKFGDVAGERLSRAVASTPDHVFNIIREHGLNCDPIRNGWVQAAITSKQFEQQQILAEEYQNIGARMEVLSASELTTRTGTSAYVGGLFAPTAGAIHPLSYTRELARTSMALGANVYTDSPVTELKPVNGGWQVKTNNGQIECKEVLVCTNAYTDSAVAGLAKKIVPVRSVLIASEPLPQNLRDTILPGKITFVDKRRVILYFRYDRDGRLCVGDHGPTRDTFKLDDFNNLKQRAAAVFAPLADVKWDYHWGGRVGMTKDGLPFVHRIAPGLTAGMGYNGRGVGMGSLMGKVLADLVLGKPDELSDFPITSPKAFKMHAFHKIGITASVKWFALRDYLEAVSRG